MTDNLKLPMDKLSTNISTDPKMVKIESFVDNPDVFDERKQLNEQAAKITKKLEQKLRKARKLKGDAVTSAKVSKEVTDWEMQLRDTGSVAHFREIIKAKQKEL